MRGDLINLSRLWYIKIKDEVHGAEITLPIFRQLRRSTKATSLVGIFVNTFYKGNKLTWDRFTSYGS